MSFRKAKDTFIRKQKISLLIEQKCKKLKISKPNFDKLTTKQLIGIHGTLCQKLREKKNELSSKN